MGKRGEKSLLRSCLLKVGIFFISLSEAKSCDRLDASPTQHSKAGLDLPVQGHAASDSKAHGGVFPWLPWPLFMFVFSLSPSHCSNSLSLLHLGESL